MTRVTHSTTQSRRAKQQKGPSQKVGRRAESDQKTWSKFGYMTSNSEDTDPRGLKSIFSRGKRPVASRAPSMPVIGFMSRPQAEEEQE